MNLSRNIHIQIFFWCFFWNHNKKLMLYSKNRTWPMYLGKNVCPRPRQTDIKGSDLVCQKKFFFFFFILLFKKTIFIFCDYFLIYKRFAMNWNWWKINWLYQLFHKSLKNAQKTQNSPKGLHSVFCQKQIFFSLLRVSEHRFWKLLKNCIECISPILDRTIP